MSRGLKELIRRNFVVKHNTHYRYNAEKTTEQILQELDEEEAKIKVELELLEGKSLN